MEHPDSDEFVEINPERLSGSPAVRGTRVFASTVRDLVKDGYNGWDALRDGYDLDDYTIDGVAAWWQAHGSDWPDDRRFSRLVLDVSAPKSQEG